MLNRVDPTPIDAINSIEKYLARFTIRVISLELKGHSWSGRCAGKSINTTMGWLGESLNLSCRQRHKT